MLALGGGHRRDDRLGLLEHIVRNVHVLEHLAHAGEHRSEVLEVAHLLDLLNLRDEVVEVELVFDQFLFELAGLLLVELLLCAFHERHHVAHAQDSVGHALGVEHLQGVHLLAARNELEGLVDHRTDRNGRTAAGVAVELGEDHAVEVQPFVELPGGVHCVLTRHGVDDEQRLRRFHGGLDGRDLLHHRLVHGQTARGVDDHHVVILLPGVLDTVLGDLDRIPVTLLGVDLHADLSAEHFQLVDGCGTVNVACHQQHLAALLRLEQRSQLAREGRLTRTLQTRDQNHRRRALQPDVRGRAAHQFGQLVADDLGHHLSRLDGFEHVLAQGFLLHFVGKGLGDLVVDVGVDQRAADLLERLRDVDLGDAPLAFENFERPFEFIC